MRDFFLGLAVLSAALLPGCSNRGPTVDPSNLNTVEIRLPDGFKIRAEMMVRAEELLKGMKFRPSLAADRGMLFMHSREGRYPHWMYEVLVPLDMIWMDKERRIVQLVHNTPPCPGPKEKCLSYGGQYISIYILEVPAGTAARHGLKPGMQLDF